MSQDEVMTTAQAAKYLKVSESALNSSRKRGGGVETGQWPAYVKFGRAVRYLKGDLDVWLVKHRVAEISEPQ